MALLDWIVIGAAGLYIRSQKKNNEERESEENARIDAIMRDIELQRNMHQSEQTEYERRRAVNSVRRNMPCLFSDQISPTDFQNLAMIAVKHVKRIKEVFIRGATVYCTVESQTGLSDWKFNVDFNNWGHINGTFWTHSDNSDSSIPKHYGKILSGLIHDFMYENNLTIDDFSDYVDENTALETASGLNTNYREQVLKKLFRNNVNRINVCNRSKYYCGEHIYPVISMLKKNGFVNIKSIPIEDVDDKSQHYIYEVDRLSIAGSFDFESAYAFPHDTEVVIYYHSKRRIIIPYNEKSFRKKNYITVGDYLHDLGFTEIYERPIRDLTVGLITKNGSVENVYIVEDHETPILQGKLYDYDTRIIVTYHTFS